MTEYVNTPILPEKAKELMALDTEDKEIITYGKIEEWFTAWGGKCYVSFSAGKDSTVLAYLATNWLAHFRTPPWPLNLVFVNTGLEYPEIQRFVDEYTAWLRREFPRVTINLARLWPKINIRQVIEKYGYMETQRKGPRLWPGVGLCGGAVLTMNIYDELIYRKLDSIESLLIEILAEMKENT